MTFSSRRQRLGLRLSSATALMIVGAWACDTAPAATAQKDPALVRLEQWRTNQQKQECPDVPQDEPAKDLVRRGQLGTGPKVSVFGETDPYNRRDEILQHLWSRPNPRGAGTIVTASRDGKNDMANRTRRRAVWLVLDKTVYPLNVPAAAAFGRLSSGLPKAVAKKAGLPDSYFKIEEHLGFEDEILFRWHGNENPLPSCPQR